MYCTCTVNPVSHCMCMAVHSVFQVWSGDCLRQRFAPQDVEGSETTDTGWQRGRRYSHVCVHVIEINLSRTLTKVVVNCPERCLLSKQFFSGCVFGTRKFRQVAIIARTNLGLFEEMARVLRSPEAKKKKLGFVGVRIACNK